MENKSNKILLTVIGAATLLVALVGATFAYFSATGTSQTQTVTTGTSAIELNATKNAVTNIKPTTFDKAAADAGTNTDIVKITLTVSGDTTTAGQYDIIMNEPVITLCANVTDNAETTDVNEKEQCLASGGAITDINYAVYNGDDEVTKGTFTELDEVKETTIIANTEYAAGTISGTYDVYVWIDNKNEAQDALQDLSFNLTFTADATTQL